MERDCPDQLVHSTESFFPCPWCNPSCPTWRNNSGLHKTVPLHVSSKARWVRTLVNQVPPPARLLRIWIRIPLQGIGSRHNCTIHFFAEHWRSTNSRATCSPSFPWLHQPLWFWPQTNWAAASLGITPGFNTLVKDSGFPGSIVLTYSYQLKKKNRKHTSIDKKKVLQIIKAFGRSCECIYVEGVCSSIRKL